MKKIEFIKGCAKKFLMMKQIQTVETKKFTRSWWDIFICFVGSVIASIIDACKSKKR